MLREWKYLDISAKLTDSGKFWGRLLVADLLKAIYLNINPLLPSAANMRRSAKNFDFNLRRDHQKNFL